MIKNNLISGAQTNSFYVRLVFASIVILVLRLIAYRKNDRIQKINFLNKLRISNETSVARDKMQMLMPEFIIERISNFEISSELSILFCDICDFDEVIKECKSSVVEIMDEVFRNFDNFCRANGIQKIETVGKTYMAAGGLKFIENKIQDDFGHRHFMLRTVDVAKRMLEFTQKYTYRAGKHLKAKIGIHYGSCIFGVLGYHKPQFSLIGDTINTTSRVCTTGDVDSIVLSSEAHRKSREVEEQQLKQQKRKKEGTDKLAFQKQSVPMKGKGIVDVYILLKQGQEPVLDRNNMRGSLYKKSIIMTRDNVVEAFSTLSINSKRTKNSTLPLKDMKVDIPANFIGSLEKLNVGDEQDGTDSNQSPQVKRPRRRSSLLVDEMMTTERPLVTDRNSFRHLILPESNDGKVNEQIISNLGNLSKAYEEERMLANLGPRSPLGRSKSRASMGTMRLDEDGHFDKRSFGSRGTMFVNPLESPMGDHHKKALGTMAPIAVVPEKPDEESLRNITSTKDTKPAKSPKSPLSPRRAVFSNAIETQLDKMKINIPDEEVNQLHLFDSKPQSGELKEPGSGKRKEHSSKRTSSGRMRTNTDDLASIYSRKNSVEDFSDSEDEKRSSDRNSDDEIVEMRYQEIPSGNHTLWSNSKSKLVEDFKRKNLIRYSSTANLCLGLVILDIFLSEIYYFSESNFDPSMGTYRMSHYLIALGLLIVIIMKTSLNSILLYKIAIFTMFFARLAIDLLEIYLFHTKKKHKTVIALLMRSCSLRCMVETLFLQSSGLFYPPESICINLIYFCVMAPNIVAYNTTWSSLFEVSELLIFFGFNISETIAHYRFESQSYHRMIAANKMSIQYVKFVNRLLPKHIQQSAVLGNKSETYLDVTILFADIVGYTAYSAGKPSRQVVEMLSKLFTEFDKECNRLNLFKLYTIGDCYVVMGFLDKRNRKNPAEEANDVVQFGISMISIISKVRKMIKNSQLNMRIGIHTGMVYGGLIGTDIVRFDLYGPDLVIANKMESGGQEGQINISERTKQLLEELETINYTFEENQKIDIKSTDTKIQSYFVRWTEKEAPK